MFHEKKITLYVTGGIALYKTIDLMRTLIKKGAEVRVAMTPAATEFISPILFEKLSKHKVYVDLFSEEDPTVVAHVELADWSDLAVVTPATANTIAKLTYGIADNFVTSALLASKCPTFVIPAMNENMYEHPATQANFKQLRARGVYLMEPDTGFLAEGYDGKGRYPEQERIIDELEIFIRDHATDLPLRNKKILITAGGTQEPIDPVRMLTNRSSGKMGHAIAAAAFRVGADVTLVTASPLKTHRGIRTVRVKTANEMYAEVDDHFKNADALIMAAAVSDYRVKKEAKQKMKKQESLQIELIKNPDILKKMGQKKQQQFIIGFAAETEDLLKNAAQKLKEKNVDAIVANSVAADRGFDVDKNAGYLLTATGKSYEIPTMAKYQMAEKIIQYLVDQLTD